MLVLVFSRGIFAPLIERGEPHFWRPLPKQGRRRFQGPPETLLKERGHRKGGLRSDLPPLLYLYWLPEMEAPIPPVLPPFSIDSSTWALVMCTIQECKNSNCRGLKNTNEFDIQLEIRTT
ncbi:hypothetical protein CDL15_Pgr007777 [Punica granatum]|uniref:Uncharacterized protein n=1 Tax=Punica granatum TaxID=22663 RepID=A0A218XAL6_PUNGR|nr:hypothetical protein CDL15_Pgr007777 [Punica granatum]